MTKMIAPLGAVLMLAGCAGPATRPEVSLSLRGDHVAIAECAYKALGVGIRMTRLENAKTVELAFEDSGMRFWSIDLVGTGPDQTRADIRAGPSLVGPDANARGFVPKIEACARQVGGG